jgi:hypothetical protein
MNAKAGEDHAGDVTGAEKEIEIVGLQGNVLDGDNRSSAGGKTEASEGGIVGFEAGMRKIGTVKILKSGGDGKTLFESLGDAGLRKGPTSGEDNAADEKKEEECGGGEKQRFKTQF